MRLTPLPALPEMMFGAVPREADEVAGRAGVDGHAVAGVGQGVLAVDVGADVDAEDLVGVGPAPEIRTPSPPLSEMTSGADEVPLTTLSERRRRRWPRR